MFYVGLDIHTKHISICALSETGQVAHRSRVRSIEEMMQILKGLPDRFEVCYEASCGYGHFHDLLRPLAARVLVAHPGQLRLIFRSKNKNDRNDAERLAKLLYLGETPTVHVPSLEVRTWRELINCRSQVIAKRTRGPRIPFARSFAAPALSRRDNLPCGPRRGCLGCARWTCPRLRSNCGGICCSKRSRRSCARCDASNDS
jgi:transposase